MQTYAEARKEAKANRNKWMGGAVVVEYKEGYDAIPAMYLSDISYTGSRKVVERWPPE